MASLTCPGCRSPMKAVELARHGAGTQTIDLCVDCQVLWFDRMESPQLSPAGTLDLFRQINEARPDVRRPLPQHMTCPRCDSPLAHTQDLQHTTRFSYYRCSRGHGRLTPFFQFLQEKNFIRPVPKEELERLKTLVRIIRCSSCGAPIDLAKSTACEFCRAPIAVLDPEAASKALRELSAARNVAQPPMDDAARAAAAVMAAAHFERALAREQAQQDGGLAVDLVAIGLSALASLLRSN